MGAGGCRAQNVPDEVEKWEWTRKKCISGLAHHIKDLDRQRARKTSVVLSRSELTRYMFWKEHSNANRE